ncbi:hypothetical protein A2397_01910 [Candidatus Amesbacteria bacterium RIFOXYB1_FULL_44_23]|uniref:AB hydrolase-1 domain-containing protein n=1 Tax=Candidatus Amesbacteria bacterium RIFOXYB1_FULL_44_23 TaxID=1797263 RepID=A0A1F4ZSK5_9BACT|nr:MAG: hypothetical protein A2397_01910 [Candidatus Amesbacteria bacterium RIFOXYB1_FULL_44_23]
MLGKRIKLAVEHEWDFLGSKQSYRKLGQGLPVVLLHGSMVADPWDGFEKRLAEHFEVYVPDLPGFGASDAIEGRVHDTQFFSEALAEFLKHSKLEQAPIIAFSLGAVVAVKTASGGGTLGKLILVGLPIRLESKLLDQICRMPLIARRVLATDELTRGGVLLAILKDVIGITEAKFLPKYLNLLRTTDVRAMVDTDLISEVEKELPWYLNRITNPVWFVYGEHDKLKNGAEKWLQRRIMVVKGAGHDVFIGRPEATLTLIRRILEKQQSLWDKIRRWWNGA